MNLDDEIVDNKNFFSVFLKLVLHLYLKSHK